METKLVSNLGRIHGILSRVSRQQDGLPHSCGKRPTYRQILFVGKDQQDSISKLILVEHALQLLAGFNNTVSIIAVNNEDNTLCVLEVMTP